MLTLKDMVKQNCHLQLEMNYGVSMTTQGTLSELVAYQFVQMDYPCVEKVTK